MSSTSPLMWKIVTRSGASIEYLPHDRPTDRLCACRARAGRSPYVRSGALALRVPGLCAARRAGVHGGRVYTEGGCTRRAGAIVLRQTYQTHKFVRFCATTTSEFGTHCTYLGETKRMRERATIQPSAFGSGRCRRPQRRGRAAAGHRKAAAGAHEQ